MKARFASAATLAFGLLMALPACAQNTTNVSSLAQFKTQVSSHTDLARRVSKIGLVPAYREWFSSPAGKRNILTRSTHESRDIAANESLTPADRASGERASAEPTSAEPMPATQASADETLGAPAHHGWSEFVALTKQRSDLARRASKIGMTAAGYEWLAQQRSR